MNERLTLTSATAVPMVFRLVLGRDLIAFVQRVVLIVNCGVQIFTFLIQVNVVHQRALGQYAKAGTCDHLFFLRRQGDSSLPSSVWRMSLL